MKSDVVILLEKGLVALRIEVRSNKGRAVVAGFKLFALEREVFELEGF